MNDLFRNRYWKVFLVTFCISAPIFILSVFQELFLLLVMSAVLTVVLKPLVDKVESKGMSRTLAILSIYVLFGAFVVLGLITIYPIVVAQVIDISSRLDQQHLVPMLKKFSASLSQQVPFMKADEITVRINTMLSDMSRSMETLLTSALSMAMSLIIVPFITFFLLLDYYAMQKNLVENIPNKYFEMTLNLLQKLEEQVSKYIQGTCIESIVVALLYIIAYYIMGVNYAIVLGIVGGIMNIIPFAGPFIGAVPVLIVTMIQFGDLSMLIPIIISTVVVQQLDQIFVQPTVFSKILDIHPLTMFLVILIGGQVLGVLGMVLSIPIYTIITVTARETNWGLKNYRITE